MSSPAAAAPSTAKPQPKALFRMSTDGDDPMAADGSDEDEPSARDRAKVEEIMVVLRREAEELSNTDWLYESNDPDVTSRIKL